MTSKEKSYRIIKRIEELTDNGKTVTFANDWDKYSLTVFIDEDHFHTYTPDNTLDQMIDSLYDNLHDSRWG